MALTIAQLAPNVRGAVIVPTPQDVAEMDAIKAAKFIGKLALPVLGVIENMSGMSCPHCGKDISLFGEGGGKKAAEDLGVPYLGAIPPDPEWSNPAMRADRISSAMLIPRLGEQSIM